MEQGDVEDNGLARSRPYRVAHGLEPLLQGVGRERAPPPGADAVGPSVAPWNDGQAPTALHNVDEWEDQWRAERAARDEGAPGS